MDTNQPPGTTPSDDDTAIMAALEQIEQRPGNTVGDSEPEQPEETEETTEEDDSMPESPEDEESGDEEQEEDQDPEESVEEESETDEDDEELPDGVKERTRKQYEKLKENNRKLKEENERLRQGGQPTQQKPAPSVFDQFHQTVPSQAAPPQVPQGQQHVVDAQNYNNLDQQQVNDVVSQHVEYDQDGNPVIDIGKVQDTLLAADRRAARAEQVAQEALDRVNQQSADQLQANEAQQLQEAYAKYPQLDPQSDKFDPNFNELIRDRLVNNFVNSQNIPLVQVADNVASMYAPMATQAQEEPETVPKETVAKEREQAVQDYKKAQDAKRRQGPISKGKGEKRKEDVARRKKLRAEARSGDNNALAELL